MDRLKNIEFSAKLKYKCRKLSIYVTRLGSFDIHDKIFDDV